MAALWDLPVVFACINNQWGMGTRVDRATRGTELHERALGFGLAGASVDGLDAGLVERVARETLEAARAGRPGFLAVACYRFFGHARKDKSPYRTEAEEAEGRGRDPLRFAREGLLDAGHEAGSLDAVDREAEAEMDAAVDFAVAAAAPEPETVFRDVYAPGEPEPEPVRARLERVLGHR